MKKRILALSLAGLMSFSNLAFAQEYASCALNYDSDSVDATFHVESEDDLANIFCLNIVKCQVFHLSLFLFQNYDNWKTYL